MQNLLMPNPRAPPALPAFWSGPVSTGQPGQGRTTAQTDELFVELLNAFRVNGGLARLNEVIALTRSVCTDEVTRMTAWIIERKVVSFEWQADLWLPLFQFNRTSMVPTPATAQVVQALNPVLGPWALATWFARPHVLLGFRSPADAMDTSFPAVMHAALADSVNAVV